MPQKQFNEVIDMVAGLWAFPRIELCGACSALQSAIKIRKHLKLKSKRTQIKKVYKKVLWWLVCVQDLGNVHTVLVGHNGKGSKPRWHLEKVCFTAAHTLCHAPMSPLSLFVSACRMHSLD